ncbi:MAG: universal stress protein [Deltaproteobacteria bacterium]|nr:universal stress protein [Deltaproteobacteria bacterium]MBW2297786.1 universal stress protein [Deltaproteobacteria bacterium]MBW2611698.1 universal stress protein [Deltaproteobacteria bacterium]MBW2633071.1 universal stress protein [Deltaproteobacteria bacterium]
MKFMVCYDGSKEAKKALELACEHAKVWGATLEVANSIMREQSLKRSFIEKKEHSLENEIKEILGGSGISYNVELLIDTLRSEEQMVRFAEKEGIDQIFVGIEKTSKVGKLVFGSTAQYMILKSPCPVVTVK